MPIRPRIGVAALLAMTLAILATVGSVAAASATLRIVAPSQPVAQGSTFTIRVVQNSAKLTSGTQATVTFDHTKVQIQSVTRGTAHANAAVFVPSDIQGAISKANASGILKTVATAFLPPDGVPAGDQDFLVITLQATGCGTVQFGLPVGKVDATMLDGSPDTYGNVIPVTTTGGSVTIDNCSGSAAAGSSASDSTSTESNSAGSGDPASSGAAGTQAVAGATAQGAANGTGSNSPGGGSDGGFPLWLPLVLAVPAVVLIGLGLFRWRRPTVA